MTFYYAGRCDRPRNARPRNGKPRYFPHCRLECDDLEAGAGGYSCRRGYLRPSGRKGGVG